MPLVDFLQSLSTRIWKRLWIMSLFLVCSIPLQQNFRAAFSSNGAGIFEGTLYLHRLASFDALSNFMRPKKRTVAYAASVTGFKKGDTGLLESAAVLHQSIKLAMQKSARYDYHIYAFAHPDAESIAPKMKQLGYRIQIRDTPFDVSDIPNKEFVAAQKGGCCFEKEYINLYSWLLLDYQVVIHLYLNTLVLKPMDDLFDLMTDPNYDRKNFQNAAMWTNMGDYDGDVVDFLFTRDYYMVHPPYHQPHQIGVQGGFLAVRPNADTFAKLVETIVTGSHWSERTELGTEGLSRIRWLLWCCDHSR